MAPNTGNGAFLPVTDSKFVQQRPSEHLVKGNLNGNRALIGVGASSVRDICFSADL